MNTHCLRNCRALKATGRTQPQRWMTLLVVVLSLSFAVDAAADAPTSYQQTWLNVFEYEPAKNSGRWVDPSAEVVGDFDGNGYSDLAYVFSDNGLISIDVYFTVPGANGAGFQVQASSNTANARWTTQQGTWMPGFTSFVAGDFNGDGRVDIAYIFDPGDGTIDIDVHPNTGSAFGPPVRFANSQGSLISQGQFFSGRFNNDGYDDIAYVFNAGGNVAIDVHASNGSSFDLEHWESGGGSWLDLTALDVNGSLLDSSTVHSSLPYGESCLACARQAQWVAGDLDGDGFTDISLIFGSDGYGGQSTFFPAPNWQGSINIDLYMNTEKKSGAGFNWFRAASGINAWVAPCVWNAIDMDGDGRADLVNTFLDPITGGDSVDVYSTTLDENSGIGFAYARYLTGYDGWFTQIDEGQTWQRSGGILAGYFVDRSYFSSECRVNICWPTLPIAGSGSIITVGSDFYNAPGWSYIYSTVLQ